MEGKYGNNSSSSRSIVQLRPQCARLLGVVVEDNFDETDGCWFSSRRRKFVTRASSVPVYYQVALACIVVNDVRHTSAILAFTDCMRAPSDCLLRALATVRMVELFRRLWLKTFASSVAHLVSALPDRPSTEQVQAAVTAVMAVMASSPRQPFVSEAAPASLLCLTAPR